MGNFFAVFFLVGVESVLNFKSFRQNIVFLQDKKKIQFNTIFWHVQGPIKILYFSDYNYEVCKFKIILDSCSEILVKVQPVSNSNAPSGHNQTFIYLWHL